MKSHSTLTLPEEKGWFLHAVKTACINDDALTLYTLLEPLKAAASLGSSAQMLLREALFGCETDIKDTSICTYYSPFLIAVYHGSLSVVQIFLEHFNMDGLINQRTIIQQGDTIKLFNKRLMMTSVRTPIEHVPKITDITALWIAVYRRHFEVVRTLLDFGADINVMTSAGSTPLRAACFNCDFEMVKELRGRGADLNCVNIYGNTCLMLAANLNDCHIMSSLLNHDGSEFTIDVNRKARCGSTALHFVLERICCPGRCYEKDAVQLLLDKGAIYSANHLGITPLMYAGMSLALLSIADKTLELFDPAEVANAWDLVCSEVNCHSSFEWNHKEIQPPGLPVSYKFVELVRMAFESRERWNGQKQVAAVNMQYASPDFQPEEMKTFQEMEQLFAGDAWASNVASRVVQRLLTRERILGTSHPDLVEDRRVLITSRNPYLLNIPLAGLRLAAELKQLGFVHLSVCTAGVLSDFDGPDAPNRVRNILYLIMSTLRQFFMEPVLRRVFDSGPNRANVFFLIQGFFSVIMETYVSDDENPNVTADTLRLLREFRQFTCLPTASRSTCMDPLSLALGEPRSLNPRHREAHEMLTNQLIDFKVNLNRCQKTFSMVPLHHLMMSIHKSPCPEDLALRMRFLARLLDRGAHPDIMDEEGAPGQGICRLCGTEPCENCLPARSLLNSYVTLQCLAARALNKIPGLDLSEDVPPHLAEFVGRSIDFSKRGEVIISVICLHRSDLTDSRTVFRFEKFVLGAEKTSFEPVTKTTFLDPSLQCNRHRDMTQIDRNCNYFHNKTMRKTS